MSAEGGGHACLAILLSNRYASKGYRRRALMLTPFRDYDDDGGLNEEGRTEGRRCVD